MRRQNERSGKDADASLVRSTEEKNKQELTPPSPWLRAQRADNGLPLLMRGRDAQILALLIARKGRGVASEEASPLVGARRISHYVHHLRRPGLEIETTSDVTAGGSRIGRFRLVTQIRVVASAGACDA